MRDGLTLLFPVLLPAARLIVGELPSPARHMRKRPGPAASVWFRRAAEFAGSDLLTRVSIFLIAILLMLNLILWFPSLGAVMEQCEQF
jgi:hypothetical protein